LEIIDKNFIVLHDQERFSNIEKAIFHLKYTINFRKFWSMKYCFKREVHLKSWIKKTRRKLNVGNESTNGFQDIFFRL